MISIYDLFSIVKKYDKDFSAGMPVNPALVNADVTPMVVYHGTNSKAFYVFDSSQSSKRVRLNTLGDGYCFTSSQDTAERYGKNVMSVHLAEKNTFYLFHSIKTVMVISSMCRYISMNAGSTIQCSLT